MQEEERDRDSSLHQSLVDRNVEMKTQVDDVGGACEAATFKSLNVSKNSNNFIFFTFHNTENIFFKNSNLWYELVRQRL